MFNELANREATTSASTLRPRVVRPGRVLVVEDDTDLREALSETLAEEGWAVRLAGNGAQALEMLDPTDPPSVILLDLMMPVMNGWQFLEQREYRRGLTAIPVVVMSAYLDTPNHAAPHLPVAATIRKPIDLKRLLETLETHRSRSTR